MSQFFIRYLLMSIISYAFTYAQQVSDFLDDYHFVVQAELIGSNSIGRALQGYAVALSADGNTAALGAPQDNNIGKTWVFTRSHNRWTEQAQLVATGYKGFPDQGFSLGISADGNTLAIGAPRDESICCTGSTWIFTRSQGTWTQEAKLIGSDYQGYSLQGWSVALAVDGNTLAIGAPGDNNGIGATWIFSRSNGTWTQQARLIGKNAIYKSTQGFSVALSADGNTLAVGGYYDNFGIGAVWIFTRSGNSWVEQSKLIGSNSNGKPEQGFSVALSADGNTLAIGGPYDNQIQGATWLFTRSGSVWTERAKLVADGIFTQGYSVSLSLNGTLLAVGSPLNNAGNGEIIMYGRSNNTWKQEDVILGKGGSSGDALQFSQDGTTLIVGSPNEAQGRGASWIFVNKSFFKNSTEPR